MKHGIVILALSLGRAAAACAATLAPTSTVDAITKLSAAEASQRLPVSFEAVVTYYRPYDHVLFVQDGAAAIYVNATTNVKLEPGDRVLVRGTTQDSFRNFVQSNEITLLRHAGLPVAVPASYQEMIHGLVDCRLVKVRAVVRSAEIVPSSILLLPAIALRMLVDGEQVDAEVGGTNAGGLGDLLDADVAVTGVVSGHFDNKMQQTGVLFHVSSIEDVRILRRSTVDPWSLPVTAMDRVITGYSMQDRTQRTRVHGTITYYLPGSGIVLQDGRRSLWITTDSFQPLRIGDLADAIGFPDVKNGFLSLTRSEVRDSSIPAPVVAPLYAWRTLAEGGNSSHGHLYDLVSIEGQVVAEVRQATQDEYVLSTDGHLLSALFRHPGSLTGASLPAMRLIPVGSKVRVTGICMLADADPFLGDVPFNLLVRSFDDIAVIAPPPWLNVRHLVYLLWALVAAMFGVVARGWRIERMVRRQTSRMAAIERRRGRILEAMNANRPLEEILKQICDFLSFQCHGAPCWCQMADGIRAGQSPEAPFPSEEVKRCPIADPSGSVFGTVFTLSRASGELAAEALPRAVGLIVLAMEKSRLHSDLVHRSEFDLLTEIHNRFSMEKNIDAMIQKAQESREPFGLIYLDLDGFKGVNDKYGHGVGDQYLQQAVVRMRKQVRPGDLLARLGGDEFGLLVSDVTNRSEVEQIARRLDDCFDDSFVIEGVAIAGGASIGISFYPQDGTSRDALLNAADAAMYARKRENRRQLTLLAAK
ncbi:MAG: GGDEF domain-containing protein [Terracidiphilus sp.]